MTGPATVLTAWCAGVLLGLVGWALDLAVRSLRPSPATAEGGD